MKTLLLAGLLMSTGLFAAPVVNRIVSNERSIITFWPDHLDPNQYYYAPRNLKIAKDKNGNIQFNAFEYKTAGCGLLKKCKFMYVNTYFEADFADNGLKDQIAEFKLSNPKAKFSPISYSGSVVIFPEKTLGPFISDHNCSPKGGNAMDLVPCGLILNEKGIKYVVMMLSKGAKFSFNFEYSISGVEEGENPRFRNAERTYSVAVNMGGEELKDHPDLEQQ